MLSIGYEFQVNIDTSCTEWAAKEILIRPEKASNTATPSCLSVGFCGLSGPMIIDQAKSRNFTAGGRWLPYSLNVNISVSSSPCHLFPPPPAPSGWGYLLKPHLIDQLPQAPPCSPRPPGSWFSTQHNRRNFIPDGSLREYRWARCRYQHLSYLLCAVAGDSHPAVVSY